MTPFGAWLMRPPKKSFRFDASRCPLCCAARTCAGTELWGATGGKAGALALACMARRWQVFCNTEISPKKGEDRKKITAWTSFRNSTVLKFVSPSISTCETLNCLNPQRLVFNFEPFRGLVLWIWIQVLPATLKIKPSQTGGPYNNRRMLRKKEQKKK